MNVPTFQNYQVISASIAGTQGAPILPISNEGTVTEATTYTFGSELVDGSAVDIVVAVEGSPQDAGYSDCNISGNNPEQISGIVWTYPWRP